MAADDPTSLKGHILIAMPGLADPNFVQTVTCICEHTEQGAMGIVVNRLHDGLFARDIFEELSIACNRTGRVPRCMPAAGACGRSFCPARHAARVGSDAAGDAGPRAEQHAGHSRSHCLRAGAGRVFSSASVARGGDPVNSRPRSERTRG